MHGLHLLSVCVTLLLACATEPSATDASTDSSSDAGTARVERIYVAMNDRSVATFALSSAGLLAAGATTTLSDIATFLAASPDGRFVFSANENSTSASSHRVSAVDGSLTLINTQSSGRGPAHIAVDPSEALIYTADYTDGTVSIFSYSEEGTLAARALPFSAGAQAHQIVAGQHRIYVPCRSANHIAQPERGAGNTLVASTAPLQTASASGPRHLVLDETGGYAYVIHESSSEVSAHRIGANGVLTPATSTLSTVPNGFAGQNTGAEILLDPARRFLYASNRGHDSVVVIDTAGGQLRLVEDEPTSGETPRSMTLAQDGRFLVVGNQESSSLDVFEVDRGSGTLTLLHTQGLSAKPSYVGALQVVAP